MYQFMLNLLRHGETTSPKSFNGATNVELSDQGYQQMLTACASLPEIEHISSSPLQRCDNVAKIIAKDKNVPYQIHDNLKEMNFGDWDGVAFDTLFEKYPDEMKQFFDSPWQTTIPNGERLEDFYDRIDNVWQTHIELKKNVLLVTHGGVIRYLIAKVLGMPRTGNKHLNALKVDYAALVQINIIIDDEGIVWPTLIWPTTTA